ncbi:MAG: hypothetical protein H0W88_01175 [Parachlamydiaceae bacterium]|nr:hypothetical protein [Parachlamydiaceae bacterium]
MNPLNIFQKSFLYTTICALTCLTLPLFSQGASDTSGENPTVDIEDVSQVNIEGGQSQSPFYISAKVDSIRKTDIEKGYYKHDSVEFAEADVEGGMVFYYCPAYQEGANVALRYTTTLLRWESNPWFSQEHFHTLTFTLGGFSHRVDRWFWKAQAAVNVDANEWDFNQYAWYDFLLWGRYDYCRSIGLHIGIIAQTGMKMDRVIPILGADWQMSRNWKLNLVFPVNVSIEYMLTKNWSLALAGRSFDSRHRAKKSEGKALLRYQNVGAEFAVKYEEHSMSANIHAGTTLGGDIRIANKENHHPHHYKLKPSPYVGAEATVHF